VSETKSKRDFDPAKAGYIEVSERIAEFRAKHPEGSLQAEIVELPEGLPQAWRDKFIVMKASAFRSPDDHRPGVGYAWEPVPGQTPYTKDSELMNAETSAWGRAIVAALAADTKRGIATAEEVRNRTEAQATAPEPKERPKEQKSSEKPPSDPSPPKEGASTGGEAEHTATADEPSGMADGASAPADAEQQQITSYPDEIVRLQKELEWKSGKLLVYARECIGTHVKTGNWSALSEDEAQVFIRALQLELEAKKKKEEE
jgi:hypothetical protein